MSKSTVLKAAYSPATGQPSVLQRVFGKKVSNLRVSIALRPGRVNFAVLKREHKSVSQSSLTDTAPFAAQLIVNDEHPVEQQNYAQAIAAMLQRYARLNLKHAPTQLVLSPRLVQQTTLDKPALSDDELDQALPWTLKDLIDIPTADMAADYYEPLVQVAGREKIQAVAVRKSWLAEVLAPLHDAKLQVSGVANEDIALCALLAAQHPPLVVVNQYEQQQAQLMLVKNRGLVVSRQLKPLHSALSGAEPDAFEIENLAIELQRSLDYFTGQLRQAPLQRVLLALPGPHLIATRELLEQSLSLQVESLPYPDWADELAAGDFADLGVLAGLAMLEPELGHVGSDLAGNSDVAGGSIGTANDAANAEDTSSNAPTMPTTDGESDRERWL